MPVDSSAVSPRTLDLYRAAISELPGVELKGATVRYTSVNGHMFSYLMKAGTVALRLPATSISPFLGEHATTLCAQYGVVQKEYVVVPESLLENTDAMRGYFATSYSYVSAMKPKATTRKKP